MVFFCVRNHDRALAAILQQQKSSRLELERLSRALDALLADRALLEDDADAGREAEALAPGVDRLLLGAPEKRAAAKVSSMPEMKL